MPLIVVKRELVWEYLQQFKMDKSQKIRFTMPFEELLVSDEASLRSQDLGPMNFNSVEIQQYLVVHPLDNGKVFAVVLVLRYAPLGRYAMQMVTRKRHICCAYGAI